jgi:hypothetical protein
MKNPPLGSMAERKAKSNANVLNPKEIGKITI